MTQSSVVEGITTNDEVPINTSNAEKESPPAEINWVKVGKVVFSRGFAFFLGVVGAGVLFYYNYEIYAILSLVAGFMIAGYQMIPTYHRGVWTFFDQRLPVAVSEGLRWRMPFFGGVILVNTRDKAERLGYENFMGNDAIPFAFTLFILWHVAKKDDEEGWLWYKPWTWGKMVRSYTNLDENAGQQMVISIGKSIAESELVQHPHNKILGFDVKELEELFKNDLDSSPTTAVAISPEQAKKAKALRIAIAKSVMEQLNKRLVSKGIVISEVTFEDFNLPPDMLEYIQTILKTKFEKASEVIDVKIDLKRVIMFLAEANKEDGIEISFKDAYRLVRGLDIDEIAAKQAGLLGQVLRRLAGTGNYPELAAALPEVDNQ